MSEVSRVLKEGRRFIVIARGRPYIRHKRILELFNITEEEGIPLLQKARMYSGFDGLVRFAEESGLKLIEYKIYDSNKTQHYPIMYVFQK